MSKLLAQHPIKGPMVTLVVTNKHKPDQRTLVTRVDLTKVKVSRINNTLLIEDFNEWGDIVHPVDKIEKAYVAGDSFCEFCIEVSEGS